MLRSRHLLQIAALSFALASCAPLADSLAHSQAAAAPAATQPATISPGTASSSTPTTTPLAAPLPTPAPASTPIAASQTAARTPPASCPVTRPPHLTFTPPSPYSPTAPYAEEFWYGSKELWTLLRGDGTWWALPYYDGGYAQKTFWWRRDYSWLTEPEPNLTVTGRRLDGPTPPLAASRATNGFHEDLGSFMLVGVKIPTLGCWEITGHLAGTDLSFVVWVAP